MRRPAAPYHEQTVQTEVARICHEHELPLRQDAWGNLLIIWKTGKTPRPIVLAAHLDHPGFRVGESDDNKRFPADFLGGVPLKYFRSGTKVRLHPGNHPAKLGESLERPKAFQLDTIARLKTRPLFAVWDLPDFKFTRDRITGRACDDLIGVTAVLATLIDVKRRRRPAHVIGVLSRAEEVGFQGALAVAHSRQLPRDSLILSLEASQERPPVQIGHGPIIRVGDRSSTFDPAATRYLVEIASDLQKRAKNFTVQRALMPGGTCEATAYQECGFQTGAVCVALGNYHNCGPRDRIAAEYVAANDLAGLVTLLASAAGRISEFNQIIARLPRDLENLWREARTNLRKHPLHKTTAAGDQARRAHL